jgi:hypothetical protein
MQLGSCRICSYRSCDKIVVNVLDADSGCLRCIRHGLLRLRMLVRRVLLIHIDTPIEHDQRYLQADEYLRVLYKLWEGSWSEEATIADRENDAYFDPDKIRTINHKGKFYNLESRHICSPSPQRTPFLFQAGTSSAGSVFASQHAEAIFVSSHSPARKTELSLEHVCHTRTLME